MFFSFFCISITSGEGFADFIFIYFFASHRVSTSKEFKRYPSMRTMGSNSLGFSESKKSQMVLAI
jgi:hypothetical protein